MYRTTHLLLISLLLTFLPRFTPAEEPPTSPYPANAYMDTVEKAESVYRMALGKSLGEATKIEIYLLDFEVKRYEFSTESAWKFDLPKDQFPIGPYKSVTRILKTKTLNAAQMKKLLPALQATVGVEKNSAGALCHFPIHGVRVWVGDRLILETSFCWMCGNFSQEYPDFTDRWVGIEGTKLKDVFNELLPIPAAEIERFKKQFEGLEIDLSGKQTP